MTLSLDDVRNKRFRMARKSGYEVLEVDEFVDEVEETFAQLTRGEPEPQEAGRGAEVLRLGRRRSRRAPPSLTDTAPRRPQRRPGRAPRPAAAAPSPLSPDRRDHRQGGQHRGRPAGRDVHRAGRAAGRRGKRGRQPDPRGGQPDAEQVTTDARTRAERLESEARVNADRLQADAVSRAENLDRELDPAHRDVRRPGEAAGRADLDGGRAAQFEATYRSNLTEHLKAQIESLEPSG